jgi:hypothetical protein
MPFSRILIFCKGITGMKKLILGFTVSTTLAILAGCAGNRELITAMGTSTSQGVFREIEENAPPAPGYVHLRIYSTVKTHRPGIYARKDLHGTEGYTLLVNIDGQAVAVTGRLREERGEARSMRDPEEGEGIRYLFTITVRVTAGAHRVGVAFPADGLVAEREISLSADETYALTVEPVYGSVPGKQRPGTYGLRSFKEGIKSIRLLLNGKNI